MIHVCYGLYDRDGHYSKYVATSIVSIFENTTRNVNIHILHDNTLNITNRDKFNYIAGVYGQKITFYNVETIAPDRIKAIKDTLPSILQSRYSIATLYRLLIPNIFKNIKKLIYIDADTIVNCDINDLWKIDIDNYPIAGIPEVTIDEHVPYKNYLFDIKAVKKENYFNGGVLVFNLENLKQINNKLNEGYKFFCEHPKCELFDQDILNISFSENYFKLPRDFDIFVNWERLHNRKPGRGIYHFVENGIRMDLNDVFNHLFFEYFTKTPWFNIDMIGNIHKKILEIYNSQKELLLKTIIALEGRKRIFFAYKNNFDAIKNIFNVENDSSIIDASDPTSLQKLIDDMKNKKVSFLFVGNYLGFRNLLVKYNFVEGKDFFDGMMFLPTQFGINLETNNIVRDL